MIGFEIAGGNERFLFAISFAVQASGVGGQLHLWCVGLHLLEHDRVDVPTFPHRPRNDTLCLLRYVRSALPGDQPNGRELVAEIPASQCGDPLLLVRRLEQDQVGCLSCLS